MVCLARNNLPAWKMAWPEEALVGKEPSPEWPGLATIPYVLSCTPPPIPTHVTTPFPPKTLQMHFPLLRHWPPTPLHAYFDSGLLQSCQQGHFLWESLPDTTEAGRVALCVHISWTCWVLYTAYCHLSMSLLMSCNLWENRIISVQSYFLCWSTSHVCTLWNNESFKAGSPGTITSSLEPLFHLFCEVLYGW